MFPPNMVLSFLFQPVLRLVSCVPAVPVIHVQMDISETLLEAVYVRLLILNVRFKF